MSLTLAAVGVSLRAAPSTFSTRRQRVYSLAQEQNLPALALGACQALVSTFFFLGDFESARQYALRGVQIWRSGSVQSPVEQVDPPAVVCLCYKALGEVFSDKLPLANQL
jgi:hypothetical protein